MSALAPFTPVYDHPVTLSSLYALAPSVLTDEVARLENSIARLVQSNVDILEFLKGDEEDIDAETKVEFEDSVRANELTIATQKERLHMIRLTLQAQLGVDAANSHYNVAVESVGVIPITSTRLGVSDPAPMEVE